MRGPGRAKNSERAIGGSADLAYPHENAKRKDYKG